MQDITNHNCDRLCVQQVCNKLQKRFEIIEFNGLKIMVAFCNKHAEEWENKNG